jgi:hypothetical protein
MVLRKVALAVVLVLVASGAQASSNGTSHGPGKHLSAHDQPADRKFKLRFPWVR